MRQLLLLFTLLLVHPAPLWAMDCQNAVHLRPRETIRFSAQELASFAATPPLRVLSADTPPLSYRIGNSTRYRGMAFDLLCLISAETGLRFAIQLAPELSVAEQIALVQNGGADLFVPLSYTPARSEKGHFSTSFYTSHYAAVALKRRQLGALGGAELAQHRIGIVAGVALEPVLGEFIPPTQLKRYQESFNPGGLFDALRKGEIDLAIFNRDFFIEQRYLRELFDLEIVHTLFEYPRAYAFYFGPTHQTLVSLFNRYLDSVDLSTSLIKHREGERQLIQRYIDERKQRSWLTAGIGIASLLAVIILYVLQRHRRLLHQLTNSHQRFHEQQSALQAANRELTRLSLTDPLTGLANRRQFVVDLEREHARWQRQRQPLSLLMLDLDHFKQVNDHYGHATGDDYLCAVAKVLRAHCARATDLAARHGGEEFVCLLPDTDASQAHRIAETIRLEVAGLRLPNVGSSSSTLTVSIGVITLHSADSISSDEILEHADAMLYAAKSGGRNRVCALSL